MSRPDPAYDPLFDCRSTTVDRWSDGGQRWSGDGQRWSATGDRRWPPPLTAGRHRRPLPLTGGLAALTDADMGATSLAAVQLDAATWQRLGG
nr:hypothetical protein [Tanacetum cinerariifolium]